MTAGPGLDTFRCKAFTADGRLVVSTIRAADRQAAVAAVYDNGLTPFETVRVAADRASQAGLARERPSGAEGGASRSKPLSLKELRAFTVELATLARAGLALDEVMRNMSGAEAKTKGARLAQALLRDLLGGAQLSEAMARHPSTFAADYRAVVSAGEVSGELPRILGDLAALLGRRLEVRAKLVAAMVYPAILLVMSLASLAVIVAVLVPNLAPIFTDAGLPLPGILGALATVRDEAAWIGGAGSVAALGVVGLARTAGEDARWRHACDRALSRLPAIGRFVAVRDAGRFMRGLSTLIGAGVPLMTGLRIAADLVVNRDLARRYRDAIARVPQGHALNRVLGEAGLIPVSALRLVALGEDTGRLGPMLAQAAALVEGEQQQGIDRLLSLMTPLVTLLVGGGVGALVMSVMGAVLSINDVAFR